MESHEAAGTPQSVPAGAKPRAGLILMVVAALGLAGVALWWMEYAHKTKAFSGSSDSLRQTVIVPTLDTPCPSGKNVIWCSSFQLAWNEVRDKVIDAPLQVAGAEEVAARLNMAKQSSSDLESGTFYAAGGRMKEGVVDKIKKDMATMFPSHLVPDLTRYTREFDGILAYSYLTASVAFRHPFRQGTANFAKSSDYEYHRRLGSVDVVMVPEMLWKIDHRFGDLIGKLVANADPAMPIIEAMQTIEFRLDRCGAVLTREARVKVAALPREFIFDRAFLVYMQRRGAGESLGAFLLGRPCLGYYNQKAVCTAHPT